MSSIVTPTTPQNFAGRLKEYINKRKYNPVAMISPHLVNLDREIMRERMRMLREADGKVVRR